MSARVVLGANGQDGRLLVEELSARGHAVVGIGRQPDYRLAPMPPGFMYRQLDLRNAQAVTALLEETQPEEVYHVAAVHGSAGFTYEDVLLDALAVNTRSLAAVLEHARSRGTDGPRIYYANSAKLFGPLKGTITDDTPMHGRCLYSVTKRASRDLIRYYRQEHGVHAVQALLFNHESPYRPASFFLPKVIAGLHRALADPGARATVGTLDFYCDWGSAREYMRMVIDWLAGGWRGDLTFATGTTWHGREFARQLFAAHGLEAERHLEEARPDTGAQAFQVDTHNLAERLGHAPRVTALDVAEEMLQALDATA